MMISIMQRKILRNLISVLIFIFLWYVISALINASLILPYPHEVVKRMIFLCCTKNFWISFCFTFLRVLAAFVISLIAGFLLGFLSADYIMIKDLLSFPLAVIRTVPVISFILIAIFWFKSDIVPVFVAFLMAFPVMLSSCEKGFEKQSEIQEKLFKAECVGFTGFNAFRYIRLPYAMPSICSGAESSFGLCWKVVAAAEVLSIPKMAVGSIMQKAQIHLETADLLAATLILVIFSLIFQKTFQKLLTKI